ncbi:putative Response regulator PleD [Rhodospirillaceae bacterium LM-1]|nr:putative Response regulator PleD [Rhodospirillaceae bacterium LM-1]
MHSLHRSLGIYAFVFLFLAVIGGWLVYDFRQERDRLLEDIARLAIHKSQVISRSFGDTFLAADYVLRDVLGRIDVERDFSEASRNPAIRGQMDALVKEKVETVAGLSDLVLLNQDCTFVAVARHPLQGAKSNQAFCSEPDIAPGQSLRIQYMPPDKSANGRSVVLMSRTVASSEGRLLGAAMVVIDLEFAQNWISSFSTDRNDVLAIVDTSSTLLARNPPLPEALGKRAPPPSGTLSFADVGAGSTFMAASPIDGQERIFGLSRLERFPFVAIVGYDKARVLQGWQHRSWQFSIGFVVLLALSLLALRAHLTVVRQREDMRKLATTDVLTGIANRRHFMDVGQHEFARAKRHDRPLAVLMLDIDRFKSINDRWGHPTGDRVIQKLAELLGVVARALDTSGRLGGEEFAVLLPETDASGACVIAERLRGIVEESQVAVIDGDFTLNFTVSIGIAVLHDDATFEILLQRGDKALYQAKEGGRNRVVAL